MSRIMFDQIPGYYCLVRLIHKIYHHREELFKFVNIKTPIRNSRVSIKSCLPPALVNKVLLTYDHIYLFMYCPWLLSCYNDRVGYL